MGAQHYSNLIDVEVQFIEQFQHSKQSNQPIAVGEGYAHQVPYMRCWVLI